jgi:hypothetical protein
MFRSPLAATVLIAVASAASAGTAEVRFVAPQQYADAERAGFGALERERTLVALRRHFEALAARHLPADQVLQVEVLDVDLAGELRPALRAGAHDTRVLKGRADFPRLHFRYSVQRGGATVDSGEARLADLDYLRGSAAHADRYEALAHERRMLARWFDERFGSPGRLAQRQ